MARGRHRSKVVRGLPAALAASALAAGALVGTAPAPASAAAGPRHGGAATEIVNGINPTMDPAHNYIYMFTDGPVMEALYGPGIAYENASTGAVKLGFAKSLTPSEGSKVWTIVLHKGLKFSDGTPFDAAAVAYNIRREADPATGSAVQSVAATLKLKVVNPTTLRITLPQPNTQLPAVLSQDFSLVASPTAIKKEGASFGSHPVGPGPFKLQQLVVGTSQTLVPNTYYGSFAPGQPYLDKLTIQALPSTTQQVAALKTGAANVSWASNGLVIQQMKAAGMTVMEHTTSGGAYVELNTSIPPFNSLVARQAVYDALDRSRVANAWAPMTPVTTNLFSKSSPYYDKKLNWPAPNAAKAQQLFNELAKKGTPLHFTLEVPQGYPTLGPYIQSALQSFQNVKVTVQTELTAQFVTNNEQSKFQMSLEGLYTANFVPVGIETFEAGGSLNFMKWNDPKVNTALANLQRTTDPAKVKSDWGTVAKEIIKQDPIIFTQIGDIGLAYNAKDLGGVRSIEIGQVPLWGQVYSKS